MATKPNLAPSHYPFVNEGIFYSVHVLDIPEFMRQYPNAQRIIYTEN